MSALPAIAFAEQLADRILALQIPPGVAEKCLDLAVDRRIFVEIVAGDLDGAEDGAEEERHQHREAGLLERQPLCQRNIHGAWDLALFRGPAKHSLSRLPAAPDGGNEF